MGHRHLTHSEHRKRERTRTQAAAAAGQTREGDGAVFETKTKKNESVRRGNFAFIPRPHYVL